MSTLFVNSTMVPMLAFRIIPDTIISVALCIILFDSRTDVKKTTKLINTLIVYAVNRFVLTTVVIFFQMVVLLAIPNNKGALNMDFVTVHLKFNTLLASLNARNHLRRMNGAIVTDSGMAVSSVPSTQVKSGSAVQFAVRSSVPSLQNPGSFGSTTSQDSSLEEGIVTIEKETYVVSDFSTTPTRKAGDFV
ncbi:hypothetical protein VKT23_013411 [Stygiomarasmius scandens]|uniref:DUF6534 domain-containing protein n=1 Tax=Marasmiellus scandens TaxID=2682957 RepID=A0ABR1J6P5_9AGAR